MDQMYRSSGQTHERSIIDHSMDAHGAPIDLQTWMGLKASDDGYLRHGEGGQPIRACLGASCSKARLPIHEHTHGRDGGVLIMLSRVIRWAVLCWSADHTHSAK